MSFRISVAVIVLVAILCDHSNAKEQSKDDFKAYSMRRIASVDKERLDAFVDLVDKDQDGMISDAEFASRIAVFQKIFTSVQRTARSGHDLPDNWLTDFAKAKETSAKSGKPILAMFSASWCGPCKAMIAQVYPDDDVIEALKPFVPVYVDSEKLQELATANDIRAFPTFICFDSDGEAIERKVGGGNVSAFVEMLADFQKASAVQDAEVN